MIEDPFERAFLVLLKSRAGKDASLDGQPIRALYDRTVDVQTLYDFVNAKNVKAVATVHENILPAESVNGLIFECNGDRWRVFKRGRELGDGGVDLLLEEDR